MLSLEEKQDMMEKARALDELLQSTGWKLLDFAFQQYEAAAFSRMMNGPVAEVARHSASYCAIREFRTYAQRQRDALAAQIAQG
jgi:hypothetical protein